MFNDKFKQVGDKVELLCPVLLTCGCGSVNSRIATCLRLTTLQSKDINRIKPKQSKLAKEWIAQNNLETKIPQLKKNVFGIAITPDLKWFDISVGTPVDVARKMQKMFGED